VPVDLIFSLTEVLQGRVLLKEVQVQTVNKLQGRVLLKEVQVQTVNERDQRRGQETKEEVKKTKEEVKRPKKRSRTVDTVMSPEAEVQLTVAMRPFNSRLNCKVWEELEQS
jgi:hypothetical protein